MKFPGDNVIQLGDESVHELLKSHAPTIFGDESARITKIGTTGYPARLEIHFTTDPAPPPFVPPPPPEEAPPMASCKPDPDDDHPF